MIARWLLTLVTASCLTGCRSETARESGGAEQSTHTVHIAAMEFQPAILTVRVGDQVVWRNTDFVPHTATSAEGRFDSSEIAADGTWQFRATAPGSFPYVCVYHPTMTGTLNVE